MPRKASSGARTRAGKEGAALAQVGRGTTDGRGMVPAVIPLGGAVSRKGGVLRRLGWWGG